MESNLKTAVRSVLGGTLLAGALLAGSSSAFAADAATGSTNPLYRLVQPELALPGAGSQLGGFRFETSTTLAPRHEFRLSAEPVLGLSPNAFDPWNSRGLGVDGIGLGTTRATYRYVVSQSPDWACS